MNKINLILLAVKSLALLFFLGILSVLLYAISDLISTPSQNLQTNNFIQIPQFEINSENEIDEGEIVYIESVDRYVNVHLVDGSKKIIGKSFKKVADQYPFFVAVRGRASQNLGSKISVNTSYACYDEIAKMVKVDVWHKSIQPSGNLKALVSYSLDQCN